MQATVQQPQRAPDGAPFHCERHRPEQTTLHRLVQQHAETFFEQAEAEAGADLPQIVKAEPGHKQSGGLFVPGEEPGLWPGAACKAEPGRRQSGGLFVSGLGWSIGSWLRHNLPQPSTKPTMTKNISAAAPTSKTCLAPYGGGVECHGARAGHGLEVVQIDLNGATGSRKDRRAPTLMRRVAARPT